MTSDTATRREILAPVRRRIGFPELVVTTLALVSATILLGIATKAAGAGLACNANWPLCDGGLLNLFPATFPSFFEWIHRVVAMIAGFFIVGTAVVAWRTDTDRLVAWALTAGLVLTPVQVTLGRETVLQYDLPILNLHFWTAIAIFTSFCVGAALVWADRLEARSVPRALGLAAVLVPVQIVLSPIVIDSYSEVVQTTLYGVTLAFLGLVILATVVGRRRYGGTLSTAFLAAPALAVVLVYFGRESVMGFDPLVIFVYLSVAVLAVVGLSGLGLVAHRTPT